MRKIVLLRWSVGAVGAGSVKDGADFEVQGEEVEPVPVAAPARLE